MTDSSFKDASGDRSRFVGGIRLVIGASVLWSLSGALIKLAHREGVDGVTIAFYRSFFAALVLIPLAKNRLHTLKRPSDRERKLTAKGFDSQSRRARLPVLLRSVVALRPAAMCCVVFFTLMTVTFAIANTKTEAANAIILQYTSTFWVFALSAKLVGEKPRGKELWILVPALAGIAVIFSGNAATDLAGLLIALASGLFYALLTLMIRIMRDSDPAAVTLLNNVGSALLLLPVALLVGDLRVSQRALLWLILMGVFQFGLPYYLYTLGLARLKAYQAAMVTLIEPLFVPMWAYLAIRERVPITTVFGGVLILVALVLYLRVARGRERAA